MVFRFVIRAESTETGLVRRFFLAVEVDGKAQRFVDVAHIGLPLHRQESVLILPVDAKGLEFPRTVSIRIPCDVALDVHVTRLVLAAFVQCAQDIRVVTVAQACVQCELFVAVWTVG